MNPEEIRKEKSEVAAQFSAQIEKAKRKGFISPDRVHAEKEAGRAIEPQFQCAFLPFEFECPKNWDKLDRTANANVRHCQECKEKVYLCSSYDELVAHSRARECTSFFVDPGPWNEWEKGFYATGMRKAPVDEVLDICNRLEDLLEENTAGCTDSSVAIRIARLSALIGLTSQAKEFAALYSRFTGESIPELPDEHQLLVNARKYWSDHHPFLKMPTDSPPESNPASEQSSAR